MRAFFRLICCLAIVTGSVGLLAAQGPGRPPKVVAPSLDGVLPLLNTVVIRVRAGDTPLTGLRFRSDLAVVTVPGSAPLPAGYEAAEFDKWTAAPVLATDPERRMVLLRVPAGREMRISPSDLPGTAGFVVGAASQGPTLDIRTVWVEPGQTPDVPPGAMLFAVNGYFLGVMTGDKTLLPGIDTLRAAMALFRKIPPAR
jgi:hypothetical protein